MNEGCKEGNARQTKERRGKKETEQGRKAVGV